MIKIFNDFYSKKNTVNKVVIINIKFNQQSQNSNKFLTLKASNLINIFKKLTIKEYSKFCGSTKIHSLL